MTDRAWLIGIVGGSGSGKTAIAQELIRRLRLRDVHALLLDMDTYYAPLEVVRARFSDRAMEVLIHHILGPLQRSTALERD